MIITPDSILRVIMVRVIIRSGTGSFACIIIPQISPGSELAHRNSVPDAGRCVRLQTSAAGSRCHSHIGRTESPQAQAYGWVVGRAPRLALAEIRMGFLDFSLFIVTLIAALHHHQPADQPFLAPFTPCILLTLLRLPIPLTSTLITKAHSLSSPSLCLTYSEQAHDNCKPVTTTLASPERAPTM